MTAIQASSLPYDVAHETGIRPFDIGRDLRPVAELIAEAFAAELDERGKSALREMRTMSHFSGFLGMVNRGTGEFDDVLNGAVVGNITVQRADRYGSRWQIANVAVAPACRGRGISRRLMAAALEHAAEAGAQWVVLQVYAGNRVARQLYDSLGFEEVGGAVDLLASAPPDLPAPPADDRVQPFSSGDWQPLFDLANQQLGAQSQWWRPLQRTEFQTTFEGQIGEWFWQGMGRGRVYRWAVKDAPRFDAALVLQARRWRGEHLLQLWVRPEHYGQYDGILLQRAFHQLQEYPRWPVRITLPADQRSGIELLQCYGFQTQRTLLTMRKRVGGQE
jgi:ribosomal protein S18 acetylase RimI-like enzyme